MKEVNKEVEQFTKIINQKGQRKFVKVPLPSFFGLSEMHLDVYVQTSNKPGPTVLITSGIHGDEINGSAICHRLIKSRLFKLQAGRLIIIPMVNPYGFAQRSRYLPDRRDLNRCFPGRESGSLGSRMANILMKYFVPHSDYVIDIHTGAMNRYNFPQLRCDFEKTEAKKFAKTFSVPLVVNSSDRDGSFREAVTQLDKVCLVFEGGQALRIEQEVVQIGFKGIVSCLSYMQMIDQQYTPNVLGNYFLTQSWWLRAEVSGIFIKKIEVGDFVRKDEVIAEIKNTKGDVLEKIRMPKEGIVLGINLNPAVMEGDALFHLGFE